MKAFRGAVDGYVDVADQLSRYLRDRAAEALGDGRAAARVDSPAELESFHEGVRGAFLDAVGGLPPLPDDLGVGTRGTVAREACSVERLAVESFPEFHVTANCYVPDGDGPHPAVLLVPGHVGAGKTDPDNQRACIELARNGVVALVFDPLAQGERTQYPDADADPSMADSGVYGHTYAGEKCGYAGANVARYMLHDARCALAHLRSRPVVDADRVGVAGTSGGGILAGYLCLVDDGIAAAAACCSINDRLEWLKTGKSQDAEQNLHGAIPRVGYADLFAGMPPRPVRLGAAASDFFPIEGARAAADRLGELYGACDAGGNVDLAVIEGRHASVYEFGDAVLGWLCAQLDPATVDRPIGEGEPPAHLEPGELQCTPAGSVLESYPDERTIDDLIRQYVEASYPDAGTEPTAADVARLRGVVRDRLGLDREGAELAPRYVSEQTSGELTVEHVFFKTERDPDVVVTGVLVSEPETAAANPAVVLYDGGTDRLPDRRDDVASLASARGTALVFDPRGVGAVRNREIPTHYVPGREPAYDGVYGTEMKLAYDALLLGESLFGMRVYDVLRAMEFLRSETRENVSLVGEGVGAYHALYAAVADGTVDRVGIRGLGGSFHERATGDAAFDPRLAAFDLIGDCDVPHLLAALRSRGVSIDRED